MIYYFAYGSNLHPVRLSERVPSAELVGITSHQGHRLEFHKQSDDGSGKCNMLNTGSESDRVFGAIYRLDIHHKNILDKFEGKGYTSDQVILSHDGTEYSCFTYLAQQSHIVDDLRPYHWYKKLVALGAIYLEFPNTYISTISAIESIDDPDPERRNKMELLIEGIVNYR